ncbi:LOW QUALITY PROTEIN: trans-1,2-dihydrobenzene-1,2-diol dehydrogenase [Hirundo rustica]|uniref:LOW QUALITY PROTEIN: trans-1,2-dihydrobenzene-1,2-diol dehydrogenase n=1 Tax=Hirundo rustica TaxID=43150 RepID=UPI002672B0AF|nr:LOW QUALITY PROTEIN: trans-1,2-dihydrobenzene-1,2-diol dehydrogenase [Hirundo rustica]
MDRDMERDTEREPEPCPSPEPPKAEPGPPPGPTRWGICSAGAISHDFVLALKTLPPTEHTVAAVAARDLGRAQAFARRFGVPRAYGSYEELAEDPDLDVVYVGVVNPAHLPTGLLFLRRGRAVLMEKPMALRACEVTQLVATARERGVFLMEGFWTRFFPAWRRLRSLAAGGALGTPLVLRGELGFNLGGVPRLREPGLGGGVLLDLGGYGLQMALALLGGGEPPTALRAHGVLHPTGVDESVAVTLEFPGRGLAALTFSMAAELPGGAALGGPKGCAQLPSHMNCPTELLWGGHRERFPLPPPAEPLNFPHSTGLRYEAQHVRECLLQGLTESPEMPLAESEIIARLLDEARAQVGVGPGGTPGVTSDPPE